MKKITKSVLIALFILANASFCFAQGTTETKYAESDLKAGTTEVGVNFTGSYYGAGLTPFIGYFITDEIEIGGGFMVETGDFESKSYTTTALNILGRYNVPIESNLIFFGEVGLEQINVDKDSGGADTTAFLFGVGTRVMPSKNFSMNFTANYVLANRDTGNNDVDSDSIRLGMGLSMFLF